jgi:hypothetical protein
VTEQLLGDVRPRERREHEEDDEEDRRDRKTVTSEANPDLLPVATRLDGAGRGIDRRVLDGDRGRVGGWLDR